MNWLYDHKDHTPHIIDVETYDRMSVYGKRAVKGLLTNNDIDLEAVFLIEVVTGRARILSYKRDLAGNLMTDETGELAISEQVVYDRSIQKAIYYDLDGNVHQSLVYND